MKTRVVGWIGHPWHPSVAYGSLGLPWVRAAGNPTLKCSCR